MRIGSHTLIGALSLVGAGMALAAMLLVTRADVSSEEVLMVEETFEQPLASCTVPSVDDGAYSLLGTTLPAGGLTYKTNPKTFPAGLSTLEVQANIAASFGTWDVATTENLFNYGGTTTARVGFGDGTSTIGFGNVKGGAIAVTYGWYNRKTKIITEFDTVFSANVNWATNTFASGDCGGAAGVFDIRNIMTHEAGHAAGLADLTQASSSAQTMFGYAAPQELTKRSLASGDLKGINALYGP